MRTVTKCFLGLSLLLAACSGGEADDDAIAPAEASTASGVPDAAAPPVPVVADGAQQPEETIPDPEAQPAPEPVVESDAGAPADAGSGPPKQIPLPSTGKLAASTTTNDLCAWSVDGYAKPSSTKLEITLYVGNHVVSCKRADGKVVSDAVKITAGVTANLALEFPVAVPADSNGTLVAVAVNGTCTFAVNGAAKGTSSQLKLSVPPGTYSVTCKPATGATKSRSVIVKSGDTAMAMFKI